MGAPHTAMRQLELVREAKILDILEDSLTVVDNVRAAAPAASVNEVRASLAAADR